MPGSSWPARAFLVGLGRVKPAAERTAAGERQPPLGGDPVARPQLANEAERVAVRAAVRVADEPVAARLDRPPAGLKRGQRETLLLGREVERVWACPTQRILIGRGRLTAGLERGGALWGLLSPRGQLVAEMLELSAQPAGSALDPFPSPCGIDAHVSGELVDIGLTG